MKFIFDKRVFIDDGHNIPESNGGGSYKKECIIFDNALLPVTLNFMKNRVLGDVFLYKNNENIMGEFEVDAEQMKDIVGLFPAIKASIEEVDDGSILTKVKITEIGLCTKPNLDDRIQPIVTREIQEKK
jgi:hypothetical protein